MRFLFSVLPLLLTPLLIVAPISAQLPVPAAAAGSDSAPAIQLRLIDGVNEPGVNSLSSKGFIVEVSNAVGVAIEGAAVALRLPDSGATAIFPDGSHAAVVYSDATGRARFENLRWSAMAGLAEIRITAVKDSAHAGLLLQKTLKPADASTKAVAEPSGVLAAAPLKTETLTIGQPATLATVKSDAAVPRPRTLALASVANPPAKPAEEPVVSITNSPTGARPHSGSRTKTWLIVAAIVAGAGAGAAMGLKKGSSPAAAASSSVTIGAPTINLGH